MIQVVATGLFARHQPEYAAHGIATFPVRISGGTKRPTVRGYLKIGAERSRRLAEQFPANDAFGFAVGNRNGVTVLDVDSTDERVLSDALDRHGKTPLIVRSGGHGHFQAWYRWSGERRRIRPDRSRPIDILGGGYVVAPPSRGVSGSYEIILGSLDDLDRLPALRGIDLPCGAAGVVDDDWNGMASGSGRNNALFRRLGREAHACDDFEQLLDRARTLNDQFAEALGDGEIVRIARSVWSMTAQGRNRFGQHGSFFTTDEIQSLVADPYLLALLNWLRAHDRPDSVLMVADGLACRLGWPRRRLAAARQKAIAQGWIRMVSPPAKGRAARFVWSGSGREQQVFVEGRIPESVGQELATADRQPPALRDLPDFVGRGDSASAT